MNTKTIVTLTVLGTTLALSARAEEINRTLDDFDGGHVEISNISGSVDVMGWSKDKVEVTGELGDKVEELIFEREGDRVTIKVKVPKKSNRGVASDLVVRLPEDCSLNVGTISADIEVDDVKGEQRLHTVSGDVEAVVFGERGSFESVSGDVEVDGKGQDADMRAESVSGDVSLRGVSGEVKTETVTGDVIVEDGSFDRVSLQTVNGELVFTGALRKGGRFHAEAVNGDIDVTLTGDVSASFDLSSFNGRIENCFGPEARRTSKYAPGWELSFDEGDGEGRVTMSTMNGDMNLCKK